MRKLSFFYGTYLNRFESFNEAFFCSVIVTKLLHSLYFFYNTNLLAKLVTLSYAGGVKG